MLNQLHSLTSLLLFILFVKGVWIYVGMCVCVYMCIEFRGLQHGASSSVAFYFGFWFLTEPQLTNCLI